MCKSVISALFGIAIDKGIIGDIDDKTVTDYVPELLNTGYEGVIYIHTIHTIYSGKTYKARVHYW